MEDTMKQSETDTTVTQRIEALEQRRNELKTSVTILDTYLRIRLMRIEEEIVELRNLLNTIQRETHLQDITQP